jgi:ATP-binding cassette subfamily C protein CydD
VLRVAFISSAALEFFAALSVALVAVYCGFNLLRLLPFPVPETLDLKRAFFVLALAPEVYAPMRRLAAAYHDRQAAEAAAASLARFPPPRRSRRRRAFRRAPTIRFESVTVRYPDGDAPAFDGLRPDVAEAGEITALLGPSGSGQDLAAEPAAGPGPAERRRILVDGGPYTELDIPPTSPGPGSRR